MGQKRIYQNIYPYFITTNVSYDNDFFTFGETSFAKALNNQIFIYSQKYKFKVFSYIIMPDHLHIIVKPFGKHNISNYMQAIKSSTKNIIRNSHFFSGSIWQKSFFDIILDNPIKFKNSLSYIKNNPVKANLESKFLSFPYYYIHPNLKSYLN